MRLWGVVWRLESDQEFQPTSQGDSEDPEPTQLPRTPGKNSYSRAFGGTYSLEGKSEILLSEGIRESERGASTGVLEVLKYIRETERRKEVFQKRGGQTPTWRE